MASKRTSIPNTALLRNYSLRRKITACIVTSTAVFLALAMMWPLSVSGFRSEASVQVGLTRLGLEDDEIQLRLTRSLAQGTEEGRLQDLLAVVGQHQSLTSPQLLYPGDGKILDALSVGYSKSNLERNKPLQMDFVLTGEGTPDEQLLVELLARNVAANFLADAMQSEKFGATSTIDVAGGRSEQEIFGQLEWLTNQLVNDIETIRVGVNAGAPSTPFRSASHANNSQMTLDAIQQALNSIDTSAIKECLDDYQELRRRKLMQGVEASTNPISVVTKTIPVDGMPRMSQVLALGLISILLGAFVSIRYNPAEGNGFESVSQMAALLKIPVVAILPDKRNLDRDQTTDSPIPMANLIVKGSGLFLIGFLVTVAGFCLISHDVRTAFVDNPFMGLSRIVWMFVGR